MKKLLICLILFLSVIHSQANDGSFTLKKVILFNSGVGYFLREGKVNNDSEVKLEFKASQINDVLKSLSVLDLDGGIVSSISYTSQEPLEKVLKSFSVNLANPWFCM